jgi:hypothetical protein
MHPPKILCAAGAITVLCCCNLIAAPAAPVDIVSRSIRLPDGSEGCVVGISNTVTGQKLEALSLTLFDKSEARLWIGPVDMSPGQSLVFEQRVAPGTSCAGIDVFYMLGFKLAGVTNGTILLGTPSSAPASAPPNSVIVSGLFGVISAVIGGMIALAGGFFSHRWTLVRELDKDVRTYRGQRFQNLEPAVRKFLADWSESTVPTSLQGHFEKLQEGLSVEDRLHLRALYEQTFGILNGTGCERAKKEAAKKLACELSNYVIQFDPSRP